MKKWISIGLTFCFLFQVSCSKKQDRIRPVRKDITEMVFAPGVLEADDQYNLTAQTDGYLITLTLKEGELVSAGQLLGSIDNHESVLNARSAEQLHLIARHNTLPDAPALQQIKANIEAAKVKLKQDQLLEKRYRRLIESNSVSRLEYENARLTAENSWQSLNALLEQYKNQQVLAGQQEVTQRYASAVSQVEKRQNQVRAINAGIIYQKMKQPGDYVRKGDVIAVIGSSKNIYAKLNVDEANMGKLKTNQQTVIRLNTDKSKTYSATINDIYPAFDAASQSFIVKAYFKDSLDFRITGTQLEANIIIKTKENALVIPINYLNYDNKVTLEKGNKQVVIKPGIISNQWVEILNGLNENDVLILNKH